MAADSPAPVTSPKAPAGWYVDPQTHINSRYWDGDTWTSRIHPVPVSTAASPHLQTASGPLLPLAGWWRRGGGLLLDSLMLAILFFGSEIVLGIITYSSRSAFVRLGHTPTAPPGARIAVDVCYIIVGILYAVCFIGWRGQTVGMMAAGVRAIHVTGRSLSDGQVWKRAIAYFCLVGVWSLLAFGADVIKHGTSAIGAIFELVFVAMYLTTFLWAVRSPSNQTLQDKVACSVVIRSDSAKPLPTTS